MEEWQMNEAVTNFMQIRYRIINHERPMKEDVIEEPCLGGYPLIEDGKYSGETVVATWDESGFSIDFSKDTILNHVVLEKTSFSVEQSIHDILDAVEEVEGHMRGAGALKITRCVWTPISGMFGTDIDSKVFMHLSMVGVK